MLLLCNLIFNQVNIISTETYDIRFKDDGYAYLKKLISIKSYTKYFVIVDEHTKQFCLHKFKKQFSYKYEIIEISSGEINKNINICLDVWNSLTSSGADRKSLIINLGGGVITDMGGFIASTFKRGIDFVNIPTTLLSMVDASIGSKTGINFNSLKNQIGLFSDPILVIIDTNYLETLSEREIKSGYAEIFKHSVISNSNFDKLVKNPNLIYNENIIANSIQLKNKIVKEDKFESNIRKYLNFGHTIGHAVESLFLNKKEKLLHGEAIAIGMICESYISTKTNGFKIKKANDIKTHLNKLFKKVIISKNDIKEINRLIKFDKKNHLNTPKFVLIKDLGDMKCDIDVDEGLIIDSFRFYNE